MKTQNAKQKENENQNLHKKVFCFLYQSLGKKVFYYAMETSWCSGYYVTNNTLRSTIIVFSDKDTTKLLELLFVKKNL